MDPLGAPVGRWVVRAVVGALIAGVLTTTLAEPSPASTPTESAAPSATPSQIPSASPASPPPTATSAELTDDEVASLLASAGVVVVDDVSSTEPIVPVTPPETMVLTRWQLGNIAQEARVGGGIVGYDIDNAAPLTGLNLPMSYLVAAWLDAAPTPIAQRMAAIMGPQDWVHAPHLVYPTLALILFVADATRAAIGSNGSGSEPMAWGAARDGAQIQLASVGCSTFTNFVNGAMSKLYEALHLSESGLLSFLAKIWNTVVDIAAAIITQAAKQLTDLVVGKVQVVIALIGVIGQVVSFVKPWSVSVLGVPPQIDTGLDPGPGNQGAFVAKADVDPLSLQWPAWLSDCARALGRPLPDLTPTGDKVKWNVTGSGTGLLVPDTSWTATGEIGKDLQAQLPFVTTVDPQGATQRFFLPDDATAIARVHRKEVDELVKYVGQAVLDAIPDAVRTVLLAVLGPEVNALLQSASSMLAGMSDVTSKESIVEVFHHIPQEGTPQPSATGSGAWTLDLGSSGKLPAFYLTVLIHGTSCTGPAGPYTGYIEVDEPYVTDGHFDETWTFAGNAAQLSTPLIPGFGGKAGSLNIAMTLTPGDQPAATLASMVLTQPSEPSTDFADLGLSGFGTPIPLEADSATCQAGRQP